LYNLNKIHHPFSEFELVKSDKKHTVMNGDLIRESALSRHLIIPREDKIIIKYLFQFTPHDKTFESQKIETS